MNEPSQSPTPEQYDDVEGHKVSRTFADDSADTTDDVEGHKVSRTIQDDGDDDVEGHKVSRT